MDNDNNDILAGTTPAVAVFDTPGCDCNACKMNREIGEAMTKLICDVANKFPDEPTDAVIWAVFQAIVGARVASHGFAEVVSTTLALAQMMKRAHVHNEVVDTNNGRNTRKH